MGTAAAAESTKAWAWAWAWAWACLCAWALAATMLLPATAARAAETRQLIPTQNADPRLRADEPPHLLAENGAAADAPLLVWLPGTHGQAGRVPQPLYDTILARGYRLLALSYRNDVAVGQVCVGRTLQRQPDCAARLRQHRVWGQPDSGLVDDRPEDAIVPRLTALLQHLARSEPAGPWAQYLDGEQPRWSRITWAGQSQGGGMAAYIAQSRAVAGVLVFSGGWDKATVGANGDIANWYSRTSATPPERWHATYHVQENQAHTLALVYKRLGIPAAQVHALAEPVRGNAAHGEGISNPAYRPLWERMLPGR